MAEEKETTEQQAEREDLEVEEEQAEDVKGGPIRRAAAEKDPQAKKFFK